MFGDDPYAMIVYRRLREAEDESLLSRKKLEESGAVNPKSEISENMRCILIDWMTEVVEEHGLMNATIFLAVQLVDAVLLQLPLKKNQFQLLGCACILVAAKYEEIRPPSVQHLVYVSDFCFTAEALVITERRILNILEFKVAPTKWTFGVILGRAANLEPREINFLNFLLEISLLDMSMNKYPASLVSAAAVHLSIQILRFPDDTIWPSQMTKSSGYTEKELAPVVIHLRRLHWHLESSGFKNVAKKYDSSKRFGVSRINALRLDELRFDTFSHKSNNCHVAST